MENKKTSEPETDKASFAKYIKYAFGETLLVMVGILLALQVNNWNEKRLEKIKLNTYRTHLIAEIKTDLEHLENDLALAETYRENILDYVNYYNSPNIDINILVNKLSNMEYYFSDFETSIYSINDLISTGNMAIFPEEEKKAIYILKNELEKLNAVEKSAHDDVQNRWDVFYTNVDELHEYGYSDKQHPSVQNWYYNLDAKEYRLQHNVFAIVLWLYNKQINDLFPIIKTQLESTLALIEKGLSKDD